MANKPSQKQIDEVMEGIHMSEAINDRELEPIINESISRYTNNYIPAIGSDWDIVVNEIYPIIQNNLPSIFFRNPHAFLKARQKTYIAKRRDPLTGKMEEVQLDSQKSARTQEAVLNYTLSEMKYKQETRKVLLDALLFPYGIMWHGYKGEFGMTEEQAMYIKKEKTFVRRINPLMFHWDRAYNLIDMEETRWQARAIDIPLQDILDDDKLDVDKAALKGFEGFGTQVRNNKDNGKDSSRVSAINFTSDEFRQSRSSRFVRVYEVFLRPTKKELREGKKGWILLLTEDQKKPLRVSEWNIKAEGYPGKILEFNPLNDQMFGISDLDTYKAIADQKNAIFNLQLRNAQQNTKVFVGINKDGIEGEDAIEQVVQGQNTILFFNGDVPVGDRMRVFSGNVAASQELYLVDQRIQRNIEDKSGVTDLKRGHLQSGEESAASVKFRAAGGSARPAYRQDIMKDFIEESFHYLNQLNKQFIPVKGAVRIVGTLDVQWSDNPTKEELQADTDIEIDAVSMLPENPQEELRDLNETLALAVQGLQDPIIMNKLKQEGKTFNLAPLIERILMRQKINDPNIFRSIEPEESMGFVSVQQLREAQDNVASSLQNQPVKFPPKEGDDHVAKLEVYGSTARLLEAVGQVSDQLNQLIQLQSQLLQAEQEREERPPQKVNLSKGKTATL
jgi:hypothetical protein